jgi:hypothetical protein
MREIIPTKQDRVRSHTAAKVNAHIDREIEERIRFYAGQPSQVLDTRIVELDREWDIERVLETNASSLILIGTALGAFVNHWWLILPAGVSAFLLQHALQGWCPPMPILRRLNKRTRKEIDAEKFGVKALRGDFDTIKEVGDGNALAERVIAAIRSY